MIDFSEDQKKVFADLVTFVNSKEKLLTFGGYAGTGKTTILAELVNAFKEKKRIACCSFTGKAASVLRSKLNALGASPSYCGTIHSLIYRYSPLNSPKWVKVRRLEYSYDLIVVDEASMLSNELFNDLSSFEIPIILVGDHAQLSPVDSSEGGLMRNPDVRLEIIHRQVAGSPIIKLASYIRENGFFPREYFIDGCVKQVPLDQVSSHLYKELRASRYDHMDSAVLTSTNKERVRLNKFVRKLRSFPEDSPVSGDMVICLRNASYEDCFYYNGTRGQIRGSEIKDRLLPLSNEEIDWDAVHDGTGSTCRTACGYWYEMEIDFEEDLTYKGWVLKAQINRDKAFNSIEEIQRAGVPIDFYDQIGLQVDYGYALTVHKAQGSQFKNVVVSVEYTKWMNEDEQCRWAYTAVTRARENLMVCL